MRHLATGDFWRCLEALPAETQSLARRNFEILKRDPAHPSLRFKTLREPLVSARVGLRFRALGTRVPDGILWFWIGSHAAYDRLVR